MEVLRLDLVDPGLAGVVGNGRGDLEVELGERGVLRVGGACAVAFADEWDGRGGGRLGIKSFLLPRGMWLTAAELRVLRKKASPMGQKEGGEAD